MTTTIQNAASRRWDALIVGAGPAGTLAAVLLARAGRSVLLVDKKTFPRYKVCGCCLSGRGLEVLRRAGLDSHIQRLAPDELDQIRLASGRSRAALKLVRSVAVSRAALDSTLAAAASEAGAEFLDATTAQPIRSDHDCQRVELRLGDDAVEIEASILIAADGLAGHTGDGAGAVSIRQHSWMGLGATAPASDFYARGAIHMACTGRGYVGLVRVEDGRLNIAAAVDPSRVKEHGPGGAVAGILESCRLDPAGAAALEWRGAPLLTRKRASVAGHRLFCLGDSAGYVEPFTGEGMSWALAGAAALAPIASRPWSPASAEEWERVFRELIAARWRTCTQLTRLLRRPFVTRMAIGILGFAPMLAAPMIRAIQATEAAP